MIQYALATGEINDILSRLNALFGLRITFFDVNDCELEEFDVTPHSSYCEWKRRNRTFREKCRTCDRIHLEQAKLTTEAQVYRCHAGLYEGLVPLYDGKRYLGSLVFGQVKPQDFRTGDPSEKELDLLADLPVYSRQKMENLAGLLGRLSEYMVIKEFVRYRNQGWADRLESYIREHIGERITIAHLAAHIDKSNSFITHVFREEFGSSPKQFILAEKLVEGRTRLESGQNVRQTALQLGFCDEFHFSKAFRKHFGAPPSRYRR